MPNGAKPAGNDGSRKPPGMATFVKVLSNTSILLLWKSVAYRKLLSATQTNPFGLNATPHPCLRFASVCAAGTAPSETSRVSAKLCIVVLTEPEPPPPPHATSIDKDAPPATV